MDVVADDWSGKIYGEDIMGKQLRRDLSRCGLLVSTILSSDGEFETAIIDSVGPHVVEKYESEKAAADGHEKWLEWSHDGIGKAVTEISDFAPNGTVLEAAYSQKKTKSDYMIEAADIIDRLLGNPIVSGAEDERLLAQWKEFSRDLRDEAAADE